VFAVIEQYLDLYNQFTIVAQWGKSGSFGAMEYVGQSLADAPKYRACYEYALGDNQFNPDAQIPRAGSVPAVREKNDSHVVSGTTTGMTLWQSGKTWFARTTGLSDVAIFDMAGRTAFQRRGVVGSFALPELSSGMYTLFVKNPKSVRTNTLFMP